MPRHNRLFKNKIDLELNEWLLIYWKYYEAILKEKKIKREHNNRIVTAAVP